jgi:hypothetical protein
VNDEIFLSLSMIETTPSSANRGTTMEEYHAGRPQEISNELNIER